MSNSNQNAKYDNVRPNTVITIKKTGFLSGTGVPAWEHQGEAEKGLGAPGCRQPQVSALFKAELSDPPGG